MHVTFNRWLCCIILLLITGTTTRAAGREDTAVVSIEPAGGHFAPGQTFAVAVRIEDVRELYGLDVRIAYDLSQLDVVESAVTPGTHLLSPPWLILYNQVDNDAGTIWYVLTLLNPHPPVSGSGEVFSFHFRAKAMGEAVVHIAEHALSDANGSDIPAAPEIARYVIGHQAFCPLVVW